MRRNPQAEQPMTVLRGVLGWPTDPLPEMPRYHPETLRKTYFCCLIAYRTRPDRVKTRSEEARLAGGPLS